MLKLSRVLKWSALALALVALPACGGGGSGNKPQLEKFGAFTLYGTRYDNVDQGKAKANAEDMLTQMAEEKTIVMVGLWAYNPPAILEAVKGAKKEGKVKIVGFDEDANTLRGIADGHIHATVVQQPFEFGYQSVKLMAALAKDPKTPLPPEVKDGILHIPHKIIKKDTVAEFEAKLKEMLASAQGDPPSGGERVKVLFVSNNEAEFWTIAQAGALKAAKEFNVEVVFRRPKGGSADAQKEIIDKELLNGAKAIAISVIDPENQIEFLNKIADQVPLIAVDNDAPKSKRRCYLGTDNLAAGREVGKLVKETAPDGGALGIFVGQPDPLNAKQRRQGVLDELAGK